MTAYTVVLSTATTGSPGQNESADLVEVVLTTTESTLSRIKYSNGLATSFLSLATSTAEAVSTASRFTGIGLPGSASSTSTLAALHKAIIGGKATTFLTLPASTTVLANSSPFDMQHGLGIGYGYPTRTPQQHTAVSLTSALNAGTPLFANPTTSLNSTCTTINTNTLIALGALVALDATGNLAFLSSIMGNLGNALVSFQAHTDALISDLPQMMSMSDSYMQINQTLSPSPLDSVCSAMNSLFGSILGAGMALLQAVQAELQNIALLIAEGIAAVLGPIDALIAQMSALVGQILNMIASEIAEAAAALAALLNYAIASLLSAIFPQSCQQLLINGVGTAAL